MIRYETLMLLRSEATGDEISRLEKSVDKIISDLKGKINTFDPWGKCRLAYPVQKNDYGVYILTRYEVPKDSLSSFFKQLNKLLKIKFNDVVLRHVDVKLQADSSIDYSRPEALEAPRVGNLDSFLKENKMENFLDGKDNKNKTEKQDEEPKVEEKIEIEKNEEKQPEVEEVVESETEKESAES